MASSAVTSMTREQVLDIAITCGKILLCSGAETSRVEDTIERMCVVRGMSTVSVFCTPSVIILGDEFADGFTCMYRVSRRGTDLRLISEVNAISFAWAKWEHNYVDTMVILQEKLDRIPRSSMRMSLVSGLAAASFAVVLGGNTHDFVVAFCAAFAAMFVLKKIASFRPSSFWETTLAGIILAVVSLAVSTVITGCSLEKVVVGGIMPFVPGLAFTNGLRDYMAGDLMSGNTRVSEAILLVSSLAVGIGMVFSLWYKYGMAL